MKQEGEGLRFNENKLRYDLLPESAIEEIAKIMTYGANKYAERNWEKGMDWSKCEASLKRHLRAYKKGIDYDEETSCLHIAHVAVNAMFLTEYYRIAPHRDDRQHNYLKNHKIALDIDGVLADFVGAVEKSHGIIANNHWNISYKIQDAMHEMESDYDFFSNMKPLCNSEEWNFEPSCYVTNRKETTESFKGTQDFIEKNGFPCVPIVFVDKSQSKADALKEHDIDIFVEDSFSNFIDINKAGILCYLLDTKQNNKHKVGYKRIKSLNEINN